MSEKAIPIKKAIPIIVVTWILSLVTTLAIVYVSPNIFPPLRTEKIGDSAIITTKLADGSVTSAKILDGTLTAVDLADGSIITVKVADGAVTTAKIADGAVTTSKIADSAVVTIKLADGSVTSAKILDGTITAADLATGTVTSIKIADYAVTNVKLAPYAIPFASTYSITEALTDSTTDWVDMAGMSVTITLARTSHLLITFSTEAKNPSSAYRILVQALVDTAVAYPGYVMLTPYDTVGYGSYTYNFYEPSVSAGSHTVKIQWRVDGDTGQVYSRTLTVIALPA